MGGGEFLKPESTFSIMARLCPIWYFLVLFWVNLWDFRFRVLLNLLLCCLSIRLFCYVLLVSIFCSKIVQLLLNQVVGMFSCHLLQFVGWIFFRYFGMSSFVCIVILFDSISLIFLLSPVLSGLFHQVVLLLFLVLFFPFSPMFRVLPLFYDFICVSSQISHPGIDFC